MLITSDSRLASTKGDLIAIPLTSVYATGGDGELDTEELRRMYASHSVKNLQLVDKDGDGIISKEEMAELDAMKAKEEEASEGKSASATGKDEKGAENDEAAADAAAKGDDEEHEVVLSKHDMKVEAAEYGKKTVLVLVVVFLSDHAWLSWVILVVSYGGYFSVKQQHLEASDPQLTDRDSEDTEASLAHSTEMMQLVGEFFLVLFSAYFIQVTDEDEYAWGYWVVISPIILTNGMAAISTLFYTVQFWIGVYGRCVGIKNKISSVVTPESPKKYVTGEAAVADDVTDGTEPDTAAPPADTPSSTASIQPAGRLPPVGAAAAVVAGEDDALTVATAGTADDAAQLQQVPPEPEGATETPTPVSEVATPLRALVSVPPLAVAGAAGRRVAPADQRVGQRVGGGVALRAEHDERRRQKQARARARRGSCRRTIDSSAPPEDSATEKSSGESEYMYRMPDIPGKGPKHRLWS